MVDDGWWWWIYIWRTTFSGTWRSSKMHVLVSCSFMFASRERHDICAAIMAQDFLGLTCSEVWSSALDSWRASWNVKIAARLDFEIASGSLDPNFHSEAFQGQLVLRSSEAGWKEWCSISAIWMTSMRMPMPQKSQPLPNMCTWQTCCGGCDPRMDVPWPHNAGTTGIFSGNRCKALSYILLLSWYEVSAAKHWWLFLL